MEPILFGVLGLLVGIAVNRAATNLPAHRSLLNSSSDLTAPRYRTVFVVVASALAFAILWLRFGATFQLLLAVIYTTIFLLVLVIDYEHRLVLNIVILPAILFAVLASPFSVPGLTSSLLGGLVALVIVGAIYLFGILFEHVRGYHIRGGAFGQGDVTLGTFMGIVTGLPAVLTAIVIAILLGGVGAVLFLAYQMIAHRRLALTAAIPYGPFFCIAGWAVMTFKL